MSLPVYINDNIDNKYSKIIKVLQYLLYEIEIPIDDIEFKDRYIQKNIKNSTIINDYVGENNMKSIILDLLRLENYKITQTITYEKAKQIIRGNNIKDLDSYYQLCDIDNRLTKKPEMLYDTQFKNWIDYLSIDKRLYYDISKCKEKINYYLSIHSDLNKNYLDLAIVCTQLRKLDCMFPPDKLWVEFYKVNDLRDIISITNRKKKTGIGF